MATEVRYLRAFAIGTCLPTNWAGGSSSVLSFSPPLADRLRAHDGWRAIVRVALSPLVALSKWMVAARRSRSRPPIRRKAVPLPCAAPAFSSSYALRASSSSSACAGR